MSLPNPNPLPFITPSPNLSRSLRLCYPTQFRCQAAADATGATLPDWFSPLRSGTEEKGHSSTTEDNTKSKKKKWFWLQRDGESNLSDHSDALPMAYTVSSPVGSGTKFTDEEKEVYEWTAKCRSCQGTGFASYYSKKGRETICKCVPCFGIGYVQKLTSRKNVAVEDLENGKSV